MKKPGRKRSSPNIPAHINADKLPDRVWFNASGAGKWMLNYYDEFARRKTRRLCGPEATLSEIWQRYESFNELSSEKAEQSYENKLRALKLKYIQEKKRLEEELNKELLTIQLLRSKSEALETRITEKQQFSIQNMSYQSIPKPMLEVDRNITGIPNTSGIYFVWSGKVIVYVGQSINLKNRLNPSSHEHINYGDYISYLEIDRSDLQFAEAFFIGLLRPVRNFGQKAHHRRYKKPTRLCN